MRLSTRRLILYSEAACGEHFSGQHPICFHSLFSFSRNLMPLGFCCGGFSSTAGYVPGNEAHSLSRLSDFCLLSWMFLSNQAFFVFIRKT
jgi:hypothetical protein